jgi:hypothetical protein
MTLTKTDTGTMTKFAKLITHKASQASRTGAACSTLVA